MLRGIACLGVCFMHFAGTVDSKSLNEIAQYGGYGVPLFFAISGFILPYSLEKANYQNHNIHRFIARRLIRLEPAYLVSILGVFLLSFLAQFSPFSSSAQIEIFTRNTFYHLFYLVDICNGIWLNPAYWTLAIEFQFYLLLGFIFPILTSTNNYVLLASFAILSVSSMLFTNDSYLPYYILMFLPGIILFWHTSKRISSNYFILLCALLAFISFHKYGISGPICEIIAISFILFVTKPIKPLLFLGTISYSLYLSHTIVGTDGIINFMQNFIYGEAGRTYLAILTFPIVVLFSWVFYLLVEQPSKRMSKKISYGSSNTTKVENR
ncbi:acyltransferase [Chitinophagales bacterium]|nr:acyltransferase [Chitinophagales bacterium]